jgi:hypothetical protein
MHSGSVPHQVPDPDPTYITILLHVVTGLCHGKEIHYVPVDYQPGAYTPRC